MKFVSRRSGIVQDNLYASPVTGGRSPAAMSGVISSVASDHPIVRRDAARPGYGSVILRWGALPSFGVQAA